jgi:hypothetical protein
MSRNTLVRLDSQLTHGNSGKELVIKAKGEVKEEITKGAYVQITVKYGLIRLISLKADLCDQITNVDLECPVEPGTVEISKSVDLPAEIPPVRAFFSAALSCVTPF